MRDVATLNKEVARLREQAQMLHDGSANVVRSARADLGTRIQAAERESAKARAEATTADKQAAANRAKAAESRQAADESDAKAAKLERADPKQAQELRETAAQYRGQAAGQTDAADAADRSAAAARIAAEAADREVDRVRGERDALYAPAVQLEEAADQLDAKIALLEDAARMERKATVAEMDGDKVTAQEQRQLAEDAVSRADRITPDVSNIDPKVLRDAGVDLSKAPGMELMDPSDEEVAASASTASFVADPGAGIDDIDGGGTEAVTRAGESDPADLDDIGAAPPPSDAEPDLIGDLTSPTAESSPAISRPAAETGPDVADPLLESPPESPAAPEPELAFASAAEPDSAPEVEPEPEAEPEPELSEG